jgi:hypothetical protein
VACPVTCIGPADSPVPPPELELGKTSPVSCRTTSSRSTSFSDSPQEEEEGPIIVHLRKQSFETEAAPSTGTQSALMVCTFSSTQPPACFLSIQPAILLSLEHMLDGSINVVVDSVALERARLDDFIAETRYQQNTCQAWCLQCHQAMIAAYELYATRRSDLCMQYKKACRCVPCLRWYLYSALVAALGRSILSRPLVATVGNTQQYFPPWKQHTL